MKREIVGNYICLVGQSAKENWYLLDEAKKSDIFFHLTSFPSCYVILKGDKAVGADTIDACARICLQNTKYHNIKNIYVDYTPVSNLEKGDVVGEVLYKSKRKVNKIKIYSDK